MKSLDRRKKLENYLDLGKGLSSKHKLSSTSKHLKNGGMALLASLPVAGLTLVTNDANAQIKHYTANQSFTITSSSTFSLVMAGPMNDIRAYMDPGASVSFLNGLDGAVATGLNLANLSIGDVVSGALPSGGNKKFCDPPNGGNFCGSPGTGYVGFQKDGYYGWMRVSVDLGAGTFVLEEYAYNCTAGQSIEVGQTVLPVELTSFTAKAEKESISLMWQTATEENNAGFEIERSTDGQRFTTLGFVEGNGNTAEEQSYTFQDKDIRGGQLYYYRLKQIDFDGAFEYSDVVKVQTEGKSLAATFSPNPSKGNLQLQFFAQRSGELSLEVFDAGGKQMQNLILNVEEGENNLPLDLSTLPQGMYFVKMEQDGKTGYEKLIIE